MLRLLWTTVVLSCINWLHAQETLCVEHFHAFTGGGSDQDRRPVAFDVPKGDDRYIVVAQQAGQVWRFDRDHPKDSAFEIMDISAYEFVLANEQGLLDIAFHPDFTTNGKFYTLHSVPSGRSGGGTDISNTTVMEYTLNTSTLAYVANSRKLIFSVYETWWNHNGGSIEFGPFDGMMFISLGDGGRGNDLDENAQDLTSLLGKVLRIDVDQDISQGDNGNYGIPADNPFVGVAGVRSEIFAYGLRNPFRCAFDKSFESASENGPLFCGDVGQYEYEEIIKVEAGTNQGWPELDAMQCRDMSGPFDIPFSNCPNRVTPVFFYNRGGGVTGLSVIGGYVYRGSKDPRLLGSFIFTDYSSNRVCPIWNGAASEYTTVNSCSALYAGNRKTVYSLFPNETSHEFETLAESVEQPLFIYDFLVCDNATLCTDNIDSTAPGYGMYSFGQDNDGELYFMSSNGVYRLVEPEHCGFDVNLTDFPIPPTLTPTAAPTVAFVSQNLAVPPIACPAGDGNMEVTLNVQEADINTQGFSMTTRTYNGQITGPSIYVRPGETLKITIVNNLGAQTDNYVENNYHSPNTTNLHIHGIHISPYEDDVFIGVAPGESVTYSYTIPEDHPAGTYWYHPHFHGSGASQVAQGMSGAFIVMDSPDDLNDNLRDFPLVFQGFEFAGQEDDGNIMELAMNGGDTMAHSMVDRMGEVSYILVNGQLRPTLDIAIDEVVRLRFINAGGFKFLLPEVPSECSLHVIATDGIYLDQVYKVQRVVVTPGSRVDAYLQCSTAGTYVCESTTNDISNLGGIRAFAKELFNIQVSYRDIRSGNKVVPSILPERPSYYQDLRNDTLSPDNSTYTILWGLEDFSVNNNQYAREPAHWIQEGTTQEWTISGGDSANHPYHQHVNHFQVVSFPGDNQINSLENTGLIPGMWRDTIPSSGVGNTVIRFKPNTFDGPMLLHCHILSHAERGMMSVVQISASDEESTNATNSTANPEFTLQGNTAVCRPSNNNGLPLEAIIGIIAGSLLIAAAIVVFFREPLRAKAMSVMKRRERDVLDRELTDYNVMLKRDTSIYETMVETTQNLKAGFSNWWNGKPQSKDMPTL